MVLCVCRRKDIDCDKGSKPHAIYHEPCNSKRKCYQKKGNNKFGNLVFNTHHCPGVYFHSKHNAKSDQNKNKDKEKVNNVTKCGPNPKKWRNTTKPYTSCTGRCSVCVFYQTKV